MEGEISPMRASSPNRASPPPYEQPLSNPVFRRIESIKKVKNLGYFINNYCNDNDPKQSPRHVLKKGVLKNFAKFTRKLPCQSLFFNKVAGLGLQFC